LANLPEAIHEGSESPLCLLGWKGFGLINIDYAMSLVDTKGNAMAVMVMQAVMQVIKTAEPIVTVTLKCLMPTAHGHVSASLPGK